MTNETIQAMENVLAQVGKDLGVKPGDVPGLLQRVSDLARTERLAKVPCNWRENNDGQWETSCDGMWEFMCGDPAENSVQFCMYCGGRVAWTAYVPESDEDD